MGERVVPGITPGVDFSIFEVERFAARFTLLYEFFSEKVVNGKSKTNRHLWFSFMSKFSANSKLACFEKSTTGHSGIPEGRERWSKNCDT